MRINWFIENVTLQFLILFFFFFLQSSKRPPLIDSDSDFEDVDIQSTQLPPRVTNGRSKPKKEIDFDKPFEPSPAPRRSLRNRTTPSYSPIPEKIYPPRELNSDSNSNFFFNF